MFTRLRELNNEFKNIKEQKKKSKKMNKTIIKRQVVAFLSHYFCR